MVNHCWDNKMPCLKTPKTIIFLTKSMTLKFAKKLPTLRVHYNALPDLEPRTHYPT